MVPLQRVVEYFLFFFFFYALHCGLTDSLPSGYKGGLFLPFILYSPQITFRLCVCDATVRAIHQFSTMTSPKLDLDASTLPRSREENQQRYLV